MSTLAETIATELQNSDIQDLGIARAYSLPSTGGIPDQKNNILVTEVTNIPNEFGSNTYTRTDQTIELNIFYGNSKSVPIDTFEQSIVSFFMQRGWSFLPYGGHYKDPDTQQMRINFQFRRRNTWNYKV